MTKIKKIKETRDQKARRKLREKIEKREKDFGKKLASANKKNDYIRNTINGRYYLARCNMLGVQIENKKIIEKIDDCLKSEEYMRAEYALMKMQAITSMRNAYFAKQDLMKDFNLTEKDILDIEEDYYDGKIIREDYDVEYKKESKAAFVNSSEN